jgi:hypothetical protein
VQIWVTKHALTTGIEVKEVEKSSSTDYDIWREWREDGFHRYYHRPDFQFTAEDAARQATQMKDKKIASLRKQIAKLEKLHF